MQSYYIQYPPMYPNHALLQRPIVASNNLVQQNVNCSKENEKSKEQDSKYLQPRWCPSDLSHTQKRRLQRMRKKEAMEHQEGGNGTTSGGRAKDVSDNEEGVAIQTSCFNIDLSKTWPIIVYRL